VDVLFLVYFYISPISELDRLIELQPSQPPFTDVPHSEFLVDAMERLFPANNS